MTLLGIPGSGTATLAGMFFLWLGRVSYLTGGDAGLPKFALDGSGRE